MILVSSFASSISESVISRENELIWRLLSVRSFIGIFKTNQDDECLVGHVPIEISSLLYHFLREDKSNSINVKVIGKRKREVGLAIPATFIAHTENQRTAEIFNTELAKRRKMFTTFELKHKPKRFFRGFPVFDLKL